MAQEFRLKNMDETRNYFIEEINQNDLVKTICAALVIVNTYLFYNKKNNKKRKPCMKQKYQEMSPLMKLT